MSQNANTKTYDIVGINDKGYDEIKKAIDNYVTTVSRVNVAATAAKVQKAIKGTTVEANLVTLEADVTSKIREALQPLRDLKSQIDSVKSQYTTYDTENTVINNAIKDLKS